MWHGVGSLLLDLAKIVDIGIVRIRQLLECLYGFGAQLVDKVRYFHLAGVHGPALLQSAERIVSCARHGSVDGVLKARYELCRDPLTDIANARCIRYAGHVFQLAQSVLGLPGGYETVTLH